MDLKAVLNNEDKDDSQYGPASIASSKRQPPPPLTTSRSTSYYAPSPHSNTYDSPQRLLVAQSPGSLPPPSAHSHTSTPHSAHHPHSYQSPFQRNIPPPSPNARSGSLSNSYGPPGQRPSSHHSTFHRSSVSPPDHINTYNGSPHLSRTVHTPATISSQHYLPPHTPLGPPPPIIRRDSTQSSHALYDSPAPPSHRHRSSSGASYISPSAPPRPPVPTNKATAAPPEAPGRRESIQSQSPQRAREDSLSVSPRTIVPSLHKQPYQADLDPPRQMPSIMARPPIEDGIPSTSDLTVSQRMTYASSPAPPNPVQDHHGIKRQAEADSLLSESIQKRPRMMKEPPVWAVLKRGLKPMKIGSHLNPNGIASRQSKSPNPRTEPQARNTPTGSYSIPQNEIWEPTFFGNTTIEDLAHQVAGFILAHVVNSFPNLPLEIEAKIGRLIDRHSRQRIRLPVKSEVIIDKDQYDVSFESTMTEANHKAMNEVLNTAVYESKNTQPPPKRQRCPIAYVHHREADAFYELSHSEAEKLTPEIREFLNQHGRVRGPHRIRVTRSLQTGEVVAQIIKARIGDLHVHCPNSGFDWRISINAEFPWNGTVEDLEEQATSSQRPREPNRNKDRLSYTHQFCRIDLTQVKVGVQAGGRFDSMSHELEVELNVDIARQQGELARSRQPNRYDECIKVFVDNVRALARCMH